MKMQAKVISRFDENSKIKAIITVTLEDCFVINGVKVIGSKDKGLYVAMPSHKVGDAYKDICHPITSEMRKAISDVVMNAYEEN
jgi:stage V sporulation protein G